MKNICIFYIDITHAAGIERVLSILSNELCRFTDIKLTIVSLYKSNFQTAYPFNENVKIEYLNQTGYGDKPKSLKRLYFQLIQLKKVRSYFKIKSYDLILSQTFPMTAILYLAGLNTSKIISVEHVYWGYYKGIVNTFRLHVYKRIRKLVVLTNSDKEYFISKGINVTVIPNPIKKLEQTFRGSLSFKKIISIGRLEREKGYDRIIPIFRDIFQKYPDWCLEIWGSGTEKNNIIQLINKLDLANHIKLKGLTTSVERELQSSAFFVLGSRFEGFGMVLVEAMQQGVPCVCYECPNGPANIITNNYDGILVQDNDSTAFKHAVIRLIEDVEYRKMLGENAIKKVSIFDSFEIAKKWNDLFQK